MRSSYKRALIRTYIDRPQAPPSLLVTAGSAIADCECAQDCQDNIVRNASVKNMAAETH